MQEDDIWEAVVVGSGFGGAVACCRLAQEWPGKVLLLERGKRYPRGAFPRSPAAMATNLWSSPDGRSPSAQKLDGLFDVRNYSRMDAVVSAGYGGGSLIYANVFLKPPEWVFRDGWPRTLNEAALAPYYQVARAVLGARPAPPAHGDPGRELRRSELFDQFAAQEGRQSRPAEICVFFGNAYSYPGAAAGNPAEIGRQEVNRYGALQTSCTYCAECDVGCNLHAKNTLDLNYLYAAEHHHGAVIRTGCNVERIVPLNDKGENDSTATGEHGYRIHYSDNAGELTSVRGKRVLLAAGTLGTNELLLRCRDEFGVLPRLSDQLGRRFSGNGDFVSVAIGGQRQTGSNHGPVITRYIDYDLYEQRGGGASFLLQDAGYPAFIAWYVEGLRTLNPMYWFMKIWRGARGVWASIRARLSGRQDGSMAHLLHGFLDGDLSSRSSVLLMMGKDRGDGALTLCDGRIDIKWPQTDSMPLYDAMIACGKRFKSFVGTRLFLPLPTWLPPVRNNITVHPLGGCALADSPAEGVVSAADGTRGQVFGYQGLYVCDGALLPGSVGANPSATIAALAEWICADITKRAPDDTLGVKHD